MKKPLLMYHSSIFLLIISIGFYIFATTRETARFRVLDDTSTSLEQAIQYSQLENQRGSGRGGV